MNHLDTPQEVNRMDYGPQLFWIVFIVSYSSYPSSHPPPTAPPCNQYIWIRSICEAIVTISKIPWGCCRCRFFLVRTSCRHPFHCPWWMWIWIWVLPIMDDWCKLCRPMINYRLWYWWPSSKIISLMTTTRKYHGCHHLHHRVWRPLWTTPYILLFFDYVVVLYLAHMEYSVHCLLMLLLLAITLSKIKYFYFSTLSKTYNYYV